MADYCKQCSEELFGEDFKELAGLGDSRELQPGFGWQVLCEGCGPTIVNDEGKCIAPTNNDCLRNHGKE